MRLEAVIRVEEARSMPDDFPTATRFNKLGMFRLIADKIEQDPALLQVGLDNIARWASPTEPTNSTGSCSGRR